MKRVRSDFGPVFALLLCASFCARLAEAATVGLFVDTTQPAGAIDLTRYGLGQGGLSVEPMFDDHADEIATLRPQTIRLFAQEYFNLYPAHGVYHWDTLDRSIENILATGARPLMCLCFKPAVLYPQINQDIVHPTDYAEWEALIEALLRHCNQEKGYGITYWEVGNEVDIGESGGCPYRFQPADYAIYYTHTVNAIRRAQPAAKVGGPALAGYGSSIGDALITYCGNGSAPLDFFSWHVYSSDPNSTRSSILAIRQKLAPYPALTNTETIIDEWNINLLGDEPTPGFQAAFVLEATSGFLAEGLSRAAYYHIRDHYVVPQDFTWMSPGGYQFMANWWNVQVQNSGLYDKQGQRRPAYYVFQMLGHLQGQQLPVMGVTASIHAFAARDSNTTHVVFWNFGGAATDVSVAFPAGQQGQFRLAQLNPTASRLDTLRAGAAAELDANPLRLQIPPYGVAWAQVGEFKVRATWGYRSAPSTPFYVQMKEAPGGLGITNATGFQLESGEGLQGGAWQTIAGGGDVDGVEFSLTFPTMTNLALRQEQSIWTYLLNQSDPDTARRLRQDPAFQVNPPMLTFQMNAEGTGGFSVSADQLLQNEVLWVPAADVLLSVGPPFVDFDAHQSALASLAGTSLRARLRSEPEATYEQYAAQWDDMGNPATPHPSHVVGLTWDSAIPKFGIDRTAGVVNDLGNPDRFNFNLDFTGATWKSQRLTDGLPVVVTTFERNGVRYEIEQFAYPLLGPPGERRGDIGMVLLQKVALTALDGVGGLVSLAWHHGRDFPTTPPVQVTLSNAGAATLFLDTVSNGCLLSLAATNASLTFSQSAGTVDPSRGSTQRNLDGIIAINLAPNGRSEFIVKLPSPVTSAADRNTLLQIDYAAARAATLQFWSNYLQAGAVFSAPEPAINDLFRANLWHALMLPRRHGGAGTNILIDLPYSNFAYDQNGTPWPVNQSVYVDYMLYDLRGYHGVAHEELLAMYRNNQEANGHVGGYANWGVYTPGMLYGVAQHYLLSHDRASLEALLPQTLAALDWCLGQMQQAAQGSGPAAGLILAPLNDLTHTTQAWGFNQAYFFAGVDLLGRALADIQHPRAAECRAAAQAFYAAIARGYGQAMMQAPLVELRDHTWSPYVPCDALTPRRLFEEWYPTDVDLGSLHLSRLKALDPSSALTTALLNDHEDNLFLGGLGMANEPVYNQHATAYLLRDEPQAAIRAFYSMMSCAFSQSVDEPVEHRWAWGQYFGPPSTDGAWFDLYRHMLIQERDDGSLVLGQAVPRAWLKDGKQIQVQRAPSYYGPLSFTMQSYAASGRLEAAIDFAATNRPAILLVRLRHPTGDRLQSVEVNGGPWNDFDVTNEWVRIPQPVNSHYAIRAYYSQESIWPDGLTGTDSGPVGTPYELGTVFRPTVAGTVTHLRVYSVAAESGGHIARLWRNSDHTLVAGPFTWNYGGTNGWLTLSIPDVSVSADTDYTISISTGTDPGRHYPVATSAAGGSNSLHLFYPANAGVLTTVLGDFPTNSPAPVTYLRDVLFVPENAGGGRLPEMQVRGNDTLIPNDSLVPGTANDTDFGRAIISNGVVSRTYTILNSGAGSLQLTGNPPVILTGPNTAEFSVAVQPASPIPSSGSTAFSIVFAPRGRGLRLATVSLADNDPARTPYQFAIQGSGAVDGEEMIWPDQKTGVDSGPEGTFYELGTVFRASVPGRITAVRVYAVATESGAHIARLWRNADNAVIGGPYTWDYGGLTGWISLDILEVAVEANTDYTISISTGGGGKNYPYVAYDLAAAGSNGMHLFYPADAGVFTQAAGARPTTSYHDNNYLRDVTFIPTPSVSLRIQADPPTGNITLRWDGAGTNFQVERAAEATGTFSPLGAWQSDRVFFDTNALHVAPRLFYRVRQ